MNERTNTIPMQYTTERPLDLANVEDSIAIEKKDSRNTREKSI